MSTQIHFDVQKAGVAPKMTFKTIKAYDVNHIPSPNIEKIPQLFGIAIKEKYKEAKAYLQEISPKLEKHGIINDGMELMTGYQVMQSTPS